MTAYMLNRRCARSVLDDYINQSYARECRWCGPVVYIHNCTGRSAFPIAFRVWDLFATKPVLSWRYPYKRIYSHAHSCGLYSVVFAPRCGSFRSRSTYSCHLAYIHMGSCFRFVQRTLITPHSDLPAIRCVMESVHHARIHIYTYVTQGPI